MSSDGSLLWTAWRKALHSSEQDYKNLMDLLGQPLDYFDREIMDEVRSLLELKERPTLEEAKEYLNSYVRDTAGSTLERYVDAVNRGRTAVKHYLEKRFPEVRAAWEQHLRGKAGGIQRDLLKAIHDGDQRDVESIIAVGGDAKDVRAVIAAAKLPNPHILDFLLKNGADINTDDGEPLAAILDLKISDDERNVLIKNLLDRGAKVSMVKPSLSIAANTKYLPYLPYTDFKTDVKVVLRAIRAGNVDAVKYIIDNATFSPDMIKELYQTAINSRNNKELEIFKMIFDKFPPSDKTDLIIETASSGDVGMLGHITAEANATEIEAAIRVLEEENTALDQSNRDYLDIIATRLGIAPMGHVSVEVETE